MDTQIIRTQEHDADCPTRTSPQLAASVRLEIITLGVGCPYCTMSGKGEWTMEKIEELLGVSLKPIPQVFARDMQPGKPYVYMAYTDGSDGWYVGPFDSLELAADYSPLDDPDALPVRVVTVGNEGDEILIQEL